MNTDTSKHTPGPWAVGYHDGSGSGADENEGACIVVPTHPTTSSENIILVVRGGRDDYGLEIGVVGRSQAEKQANAALIAAAPDLLAALRLADTILDGFPLYATGAAAKTIHAAIAKAEGRE